MRGMESKIRRWLCLGMKEAVIEELGDKFGEPCVWSLLENIK